MSVEKLQVQSGMNELRNRHHGIKASEWHWFTGASELSDAGSDHLQSLSLRKYCRFSWFTSSSKSNWRSRGRLRWNIAILFPNRSDSSSPVLMRLRSCCCHGPGVDPESGRALFRPVGVGLPAGCEDGSGCEAVSGVCGGGEAALGACGGGEAALGACGDREAEAGACDGCEANTCVCGGSADSGREAGNSGWDGDDELS